MLDLSTSEEEMDMGSLKTQTRETIVLDEEAPEVGLPCSIAPVEDASGSRRADKRPCAPSLVWSVPAPSIPGGVGAVMICIHAYRGTTEGNEDRFLYFQPIWEIDSQASSTLV
ncbi:hypothetical protein Droror1_Dr00018317, partial [Drosera rotundifolia]